MSGSGGVVVEVVFLDWSSVGVGGCVVVKVVQLEDYKRGGVVLVVR